MSKKKEFTGKDLDEALDKAAARLGVHPDEVHYRFIDEGRRGIMGLGARDVHIEVELPAEPAPQPEPQKQEPRRRKPRKPREKPQAAEPAREGREGESRGRKKSGNRNRRRGRKPAREGNRNQGRKPRNGSRSPLPAVEADPAQMEQLAGTLRTMIEKLELELEVAVEPVRTGVRIELTGDDELLSRNDAEFPQAVQFLLNRMSRRTWPDVGRIQVLSDRSGGERDEELVEEVREVAGQVAHTGQPKSLQPMNPYERRIVHITVREFPGLRSESEGDGFLKRITISREAGPAAAEDA